MQHYSKLVLINYLLQLFRGEGEREMEKDFTSTFHNPPYPSPSPIYWIPCLYSYPFDCMLHLVIILPNPISCCIVCMYMYFVQSARGVTYSVIHQVFIPWPKNRGCLGGLRAMVPQCLSQQCALTHHPTTNISDLFQGPL